MSRILIVGCGHLGSAIGIRLAAQGHGVWGMRRDPSKLPMNLNPVEGDVTIPNTLRRIPDVDLVLYLVRPDRDDEATLSGTLTRGPRYLVEAFRAKGLRPKRFFVGSSVSVFGDRGGEWVDEDSEPKPRDAMAVALHAGERLLREAEAPVTVLRYGEVYGPDRPGLRDALRRGAGVFPNPTAHANLIHIRDAVEATLHLLTRKRLEPLYLMVDRKPAPRLEVLAWLAEHHGAQLPAVDGAVAAPYDVRAMSERLVESGFRFQYPTYREGYRRLR
ncbi:MAG: hypothetical protein DRJ42_02620 [Deltaproteobacteria bacterium]|nr:MAG: hypothetical protein DRJ42_02620 [Deltaproteobacteria bacterium]